MLYRKPGIYKITNTITNAVYIGQSVKVSIRWSRHKIELNNNVHCNEHLQRSVNKHGLSSFICEAIEYIEEPDLVKLKAKLSEREYYWIMSCNESGIEVYNTIQTPTMTNAGCLRPDTAEALTGAKNHQSKLTEQQAIVLLTIDNTLTYKEAVEKYGVTKACIKDLWQRRSWSYLDYPKVLKEDEPEKRSGENHPFGKLKEVEAIAILTTDSHLTIKECTEKYNVTRIVIEQLRARKTWKQLDYPAIHTKSVDHTLKGEDNVNCKLDADKVRDIKLRLANKESCASIGRLYDVSNVTIGNIRDGKVWKHI